MLHLKKEKVAYRDLNLEFKFLNDELFLHHTHSAKLVNALADPLFG